MTHLLAVDGLPYRVLAGWVSLLRATAIWLVLCLPVVTAPAATVVLLRSVHRVLAGESAPGFADSVRLVRAGFWPALRLAAVLAAGWLVVVSALLGPSPGGLFDTILPMVAVPVAITWVLTSQWAFPVLEQRFDGVRAALRYSYLRAIRRPDLALASAVGSVAVLAVGLVLPTTVWVPYWLTVPALWAVLVSVTSRRAAASAQQ